MKCNICEWEGDKFAPRFATKGRLCVCPSCRSLDRNRHLYRVLSEIEAGSKTNTLSLLDIAPSPMMMKRFRKAYLYAAVDLQQFSTDVVQMNVHQLEFPDNYFDRVLCSHVLEHVRDDQGAMREIYRVTAPGGVLLCQVPYKEDSPTMTLADPDQHGHVWDYGDESFAQRLETAGFRTSRSNYRDENPEYGFDPLHVFLGKKPGVYEPRELALLKWMNKQYQEEGGADFARKPISS